MACACNKRKKSTAYAQPSAPVAPPKDAPTVVEFPDGSRQEYQTRLQAHAAIVIAEGGKIVKS